MSKVQNCDNNLIILLTMSVQKIELCFNELKTMRRIEDIGNIINNFYLIQTPKVQPIQGVSSKSISHLETPFLPAPDLIKSYQQTFEKANQNQRITNTTNYKLAANFSTPVPLKNNFKGLHISGNIRDQAVYIEERQANILQQLKSGNIQTTIPHMEQTLFQHELGNLQKKQVTMEHTTSLSEWKKLRSKLDKGK